jgi:hypothetical protein
MGGQRVLARTGWLIAAVDGALRVLSSPHLSGPGVSKGARAYTFRAGAVCGE